MQNMRESAGATRIGRDTLGAVAVPAEPLRGARTQRAGSSLKSATLAPGAVSAGEFAPWVKPEEITHPLPEDRRDG